MPNGWAIARDGADLRYMDGYYKWAAAPYKYVIPRNYGYTQNSGKTRGFDWAASLFGFGFTSTTTRNDSRIQDIDMGSGTARHDIFMYQCNECSPRGFYSY